MKKFFSNFFYPTLILVLVGFLAWKNYTPGTFLSGWDTLHPEFDFPLYLKRIFFGAWQEHQGIGAPAAQSHAAELTRLPVVYFLSLILPLNLVRYSFFFLALGMGSLGAYFLSKYYLLRHKGGFVKESAFLSAVYYVFNLATLQQFFTPLEMFAVHFASLPWLILLSVKFIRESGRKNLFWFSFTTLLSTSMAHTATLFYAYFAVFVIFIFLASLLSRKIGAVKRGIYLILLTLGINLFWLGPNVYYVLNQSETVSASKIHRTFSDEAYLQSRAFGNIESLGILKNFPFNWREYDYTQGSFEDLMRTWDDHLAKPWVKEVGYGTVVFALLGVFVAVFLKSKNTFSLLPLLIIPVFFWLWGIPEKYGILKEALRFPFTKFSIMLALGLSIFLGFSSQFAMRVLGKVRLGILFPIFGAFVLFYFVKPAFSGNFIDKTMKVAVPREYFEMFEWFGKRDHSARVAKLPLQTFWDWNFYSWGFQGAGFTWFGIPQPTLDREFDRWGLYNEDFYFEASRALYGNDPASFLAAVKKYQVKYLLLDESVLNAGGEASLLFIPEIKEMVIKIGYREAAKFGFLTVYETDFDYGSKFISVPASEILNDSPVLTKDSLLWTENFSVNRGFPEPYNCDIKKEGSVFKQNSSEGIYYKAEGGGVSCDYLSFPELGYDAGYIIRIAGENREGRSLKFYLTNYKTGRADLEELLPAGKFDKSFNIYPSKIEGSGYSLNFETRSYGPVASENFLTKVEIYEASLGENTVGERSIGNNLRIEDVRKYGTWAYKVDTQGYGLIQLAQGYETGWVAFSPEGGFRLLDHQKFNGWANAWSVPESAQTVYIFYWPQILEWGGLLMGIVLTYVVIKLYL